MSDHKYVNIAKVDEEQRLVFGWGNITALPDGTPVRDLHGDTIPSDLLEKASYESRKRNVPLAYRHMRDGNGQPIPIGKIIEQVVFTPEKCAAMGIPPGIMPTGTWIGAYVESDEHWELVKSGEAPMFSVGGRGVRIPSKRGA